MPIETQVEEKTYQLRLGSLTIRTTYRVRREMVAGPADGPIVEKVRAGVEFVADPDWLNEARAKELHQYFFHAGPMPDWLEESTP